MSKPKVVDTCFVACDLQPGTYHWCACGESKNQPFCDGSHKGTAFLPRKFELTQPERVKLCLCKATRKSDGRCDGSHNSI